MVVVYLSRLTTPRPSSLSLVPATFSDAIDLWLGIQYSTLPSRNHNNTMSVNTGNERRAAATIHYPFWFGGSASSMAAMVTHPLDLGTH